VSFPNEAGSADSVHNDRCLAGTRSDAVTDAGNEEKQLPEKGELVFFICVLENDLSFRTSHFLRQLLSFYDI
jgi:hypothetical protein